MVKALPPARDLRAVRADIARSLRDASHDDGSLAPLFIRFSWHCCGTYDRQNRRQQQGFRKKRAYAFKCNAHVTTFAYYQ